MSRRICRARQNCETIHGHACKSLGGTPKKGILQKCTDMCMNIVYEYAHQMVDLYHDMRLVVLV